MGIKILTVDDSKTIRMIVGRAFRPFDCEILEAANGVEGLAVASREKPNVIILDVTMPVMDGPEMLAKLKSNQDLKAIPVVMLTAEAGRENVLRIAKLGVRDYLIKPFKEELILERIGRIVELKPKGSAVVKKKRFDDPLSILVVDDKPAILDQIRAGLSDTPWVVHGQPDLNLAMEFCGYTPPDAVFVSLSLPSDTAFTLFTRLRAGLKTKGIPVFGLSVKTATEEQERALQHGFNGCITKPIDFAEVKAKVTRALGLDVTYKYFEQRDGALVIKVPAQCTPLVSNEIAAHLRTQTTQAVDAGFGKLVLDLNLLKGAEITVIELGMAVIKLAQELSLKLAMVGSAELTLDCKKFEETKDWKFTNSLAEALAAGKN
jgi:two-component system, cell cycle response regulator